MLVGELAQEYEALPESQKEEFKAVAGIGPLPPPPEGTVGKLWLIVVGALATVLVGGVLLLFLLSIWDKETEVIVPLVTATLGVIAGLLAPSPIANQKTG